MMRFNINNTLHTATKRIILYVVSLIVMVSLVSGAASAVDDPTSEKLVPVCNFAVGKGGLEDYQAGLCVCDYGYYLNNGVSLYSPCPEECSEASLVSATLKGADNREKIYNYFISQGLSVEQASGIMGNITSESGGTYSPTINEYSGGFPNGGYGIVQWTNSGGGTEGRRTNVVNYMTQKNPELMKKYYVKDYSTTSGESSYTSASEGFVPRNATTGELMPVEDNDALLMSQLEFLMSETTARTISPSTAGKVAGISAGDNEWESVKKQTTIKDASNIWVYNFEIPADIDTTAAARVINGEAIYELYGKSTSADANSCDDGLVGSTREKVVQIAEAEYALWESGAMKPGNDFDKYLEGAGQTDWCAYFASWVYKQAGYPVTSDGDPYSNVSQFAVATDRFDIHPADGSYVPQPGDLALYGYHVNIVVAVSADNPREFTTIGGNEGGATGNGVWNTSFVKKTSGTYWAGEAEHYVSPKG